MALACSFPQTPEEIGPAWLSEALSARFPGVRVESVRVLDHHAGTTGRARLQPGYAEPAGAPPTLFAKLPPPDPTQRVMVQVTGMGRKEARFYAELADDVPLRLPGPLFGTWSEDGASYLVLMEDLAASGCRFPDLLGGVSSAFAERVVAELAALHARFWNDPRFGSELAWVEPPARYDVARELVSRASAELSGEMPGVFGEMARLYVEHMDAIHDLWQQGEATLVHGDPHIANLFVDADRPGFLDWGVLGRCTGMRDVSHFLCSSLPVAVRRAGEREWIARYVEALRAGGVEDADFESAWERHRLHVAYCWVGAATTVAMGEAWQPLAFAREALGRANAALEDLDSCRLLRTSLGL